METSPSACPGISGRGEPVCSPLDGQTHRSDPTLFTIKTPKIRVVKDDPDDDKFIECALALKAKVIVTGDKSIKALGEYMGIKISTPQEFLKDYKIY